MANIIFYQLFEKESSTYTYLLGDQDTKEAVIIDPVRETMERDLKLLSELGLELKLILDTHVHADHITSSGLLRQKTKAPIGQSFAAGVKADLLLKDEQLLALGPLHIRCLQTPGHTNGCMSYAVDGMVFTGDALLIRGCGRTDFQEGSPDRLFHSVREKLFKLSDDTRIYPGHDYKGFTHSTIAEEKKYNPRLNLGISLSEFSSIMARLNLAYPQKIDEALPANLKLGLDS